MAFDAGVIQTQYHSTAPTLANNQTNPLEEDVNGNLKVTQATLLFDEDAANGISKVEQRTNYTNGTASAQILAGSGRLFGFFVNSHTNGTLKFWDALTATTPVIFNTITFAAGPNFVVFPAAIVCTVGLYVTVGGTIDYTILTKLDN